MLSDHDGIKLKFNIRKIAGKSPNTWRLNNTLLNNTWTKEGTSREILKQFELNENTTGQNLWGAVKAVLRGKFIVLNACISKENRSKINNLYFHLRKLEKEGQIKCKGS